MLLEKEKLEQQEEELALAMKTLPSVKIRSSCESMQCLDEGTGGGRVKLFGPPSALQGEGVASGRDLVWLGEQFATADVVARVRDGRLTSEQLWARKASGNGIFARGSVARGGLVDVELRDALHSRRKP